MNRRASALALALLLALVAPAAVAAPTGARSPIEADDPVNDVAIGLGGRFASAGDDPGSFLMGSSSEPTWRLWNVDGSLRQTGSIDPHGCPDPDLGEDCSTRATRIAVSSDGKRIAVAGQTGSAQSPGNAVIGLFNDAGTLVDTSYPLVLTGATVNAIALDDDGGHMVVGASVSTGQATDPTDGILGSYDDGGKVFQAPLENAVTAVAVNGAGTRLAAAAGYNIRADPQQPGVGNEGTLAENQRSDGTSAVQGKQLSVDVSDHSRGWSVAGYDSGFFAVFSDPQGGPSSSTQSVQDYQKREAGDSSGLAAVAIRPDATAFVTGSSGGRLRLYTLDPSVNARDVAVQPALASTLDSQGAFVDLAFSGDGRYLAARAGGGVRFYDTQGGTLSLLWSDDRAGLVPNVGIDLHGEHVVAATGSTVIVYDAVHKVTPSFPSATQSPGVATVHKLTYRNDGNRVESVSLTANPPAGVTVGLTPSSFSLKPGASQTVDASVSVPSSYPPGALKVPIETKLNGVQDGTSSPTLSLTVPTVRDVRLEPDGATSRGANGGNPALFKVAVANRGNTQESVALKAAGAPAGWGVDVDPDSFSLAAGDVRNVTVTMTPPNGARDGDAATVTLSRDGGPATPVDLTATVGANFQVRLVVPVGTVLPAGSAGLVNATVRNEGNAIDSFVVKLGALPAGWRGGFLNGFGELQVEDVEPGGSRVVQVTLEPPLEAVSDVPVQITMSASSLGDPSKVNSKGILVTVQDPSALSSSQSSTGGGKGKGLPGLEPAFLLGVLALAAIAARRRR